MEFVCKEANKKSQNMYPLYKMAGVSSAIELPFPW